MGFLIDYVMSSNIDDDGNAEGTTTTGTNSYKIGYSAGAVSFSIAATDSGDAGENEVIKWSALYAMGNGLSVSLSGDDNDDWDASVSQSQAGVTVSYATDEESAFEAHATYDLGGGAKVFSATTQANDFSALGVELTF